MTFFNVFIYVLITSFLRNVFSIQIIEGKYKFVTDKKLDGTVTQTVQVSDLQLSISLDFCIFFYLLF